MNNRAQISLFSTVKSQYN